MLSSLHSSIYEAGLVEEYDWGSWQDEAMRISADVNILSKIDLDTIKKLLTLHVRKERFCEGHLSAVCQSGQIMVILKRLKELWDSGQT